jgi:hypothetical protein
MFRFRLPGLPLTLGLSEADLLDQLPAVHRCERFLPDGDWDRAWRRFCGNERTEGLLP